MGLEIVLVVRWIFSIRIINTNTTTQISNLFVWLICKDLIVTPMSNKGKVKYLTYYAQIYIYAYLSKGVYIKSY